MKKLLALVVGVLSGWVVLEIAAMLFGSPDERMALATLAKVAVFLVSAVAAAWWVDQNAGTVREASFQGCLLGTVAWVAHIVATLIHRERWMASLAEAAATKGDAASTAMTPGVHSWLGIMVSIFMLGVCVSGLLVTRGALRRSGPARAPEGQANSAARVSGPSPGVVSSLIIGEIILIALIAVIIVSARTSGVGLFGLLAGFLVLPLFGGLIWVSIAGAVKGIQLLKTRTHPRLSLAAICVSAAPLLAAVIAMAVSYQDVLQQDAHTRDRQEAYSALESSFQEPRRLEAIQVDGEQVTFMFADSISVPTLAQHYDGLRAFCERYWVGTELTLQPPQKGRDRWISQNDGLEHSPIGTYLVQRAWEDKQEGQSRVDTAARLMVAIHSPDPKRPDVDEVARVAALLRPFADTDGSGFLASEEGAELHRTIKFGVDAAKLVAQGFRDHTRLAQETRTPVEDLEQRAQEYNELASRIQLAGAGELPYLELPRHDTTALRIPTPGR